MKEIANPPAVVAISEATKLKNKLRSMADKAGSAAYERLGLAAQLMLDKEWIAAEHGGDSHVALETIEAEFFHDLCGSVPLARLLKMREVVPEEEWRRHRYNLQRVAAAYAEQMAAQKPEREKVERITREQYEKVQEDVEHFRAVARKQETETKQAQTEVQRLRTELDEKKTEIAVLRGRIEELERILDRSGVRQMA